MHGAGICSWLDARSTSAAAVGAEGRVSRPPCLAWAASPGQGTNLGCSALADTAPPRCGYRGLQRPSTPFSKAPEAVTNRTRFFPQQPRWRESAGPGTHTVSLSNDACRRGFALLGNSCYRKTPLLKQNLSQQILRFWLYNFPRKEWGWRGWWGRGPISGDFTGYFIQISKGPDRTACPGAPTVAGTGREHPAEACPLTWQ